MVRLLAAAVFALTLAASVCTPEVVAGPGSGSGGSQELRVEGTITGVNPATGQVAITTRGGITVVVVAGPFTKIERNGFRVPITAIRLGDRGQARFVTNGLASKIEAVGL